MPAGIGLSDAAARTAKGKKSCFGDKKKERFSPLGTVQNM